MNPIISLDLEKITLYAVLFPGCSIEQNKEMVESIELGIEAGDEIDIVEVYRIDDMTYELNNDGHHRAVAHLRKKAPLKSKLVDQRPDLSYPRRDIRNYELISYRAVFESRRIRFPKYRQLE
jgi:hypothetical protein